MKMKINIKYFNPNQPRLEKIQIGDWIDLRSSEKFVLTKNEFKLIPLGIAIQLPEGYEAHIVPRSSTFKNFGILQVNSMGVVDNSYRGNNDQWFFPALCLKDISIINEYERICQFRIVSNQPKFEFNELEDFDAKDRSGFGSTGIK